MSIWGQAKWMVRWLEWRWWWCLWGCEIRSGLKQTWILRGVPNRNVCQSTRRSFDVIHLLTTTPQWDWNLDSGPMMICLTLKFIKEGRDETEGRPSSTTYQSSAIPSERIDDILGGVLLNPPLFIPQIAIFSFRYYVKDPSGVIPQPHHSTGARRRRRFSIPSVSLGLRIK